MGQGPGPTSIPGRSTWAHSVLYQPHLQGFWTQVCSRSRHEVPGEESPFASSMRSQERSLLLPQAEEHRLVGWQVCV